MPDLHLVRTGHGVHVGGAIALGERADMDRSAPSAEPRVSVERTHRSAL